MNLRLPAIQWAFQGAQSPFRAEIANRPGRAFAGPAEDAGFSDAKLIALPADLLPVFINNQSLITINDERKDCPQKTYYPFQI